ncbi:MAG: T9SS type A sorting domain-containing protein [Bacteroidetes bacterium]|nr:T9SS type A sorting domain-containing protein [Bacteroidota bacterium]
MKKIILTIIVFALSSSKIYAQWNQIGPNYGSSNNPTPIINNICTASDTIYAVNNVFGIHYSTNLGVTWCETGLLNGNYVSVAASRGVILIGKDAIYRSTDKGETWNGIPSSGGIQTLALKDNIALCGRSVGFFISTDAGLSWANPIVTGNFTASAISGTVCLAGSTSGLYRSTNYSSFPLALSKTVNSLTVNSNTVYCCSTTGLDISTDQGLTWNTTSMTMNTNSLAFYNGNLYCISGVGIYKSTNGGVNWNLNYTAAANLKTINSASNGLIALGENATYSSTNDGASWTQTAFHFMQSYTAYKTSTALYTSTNNFGVYRTTNNGANWINPTNGLDFWSIRSFTQSGSILFAGMNNVGVYNSTDDGLSWNALGLSGNTVFAMNTTGLTLLAGTKDNGIFYSTTNGLSWAQTNVNSGTIYSIYSNGVRLFAGGTAAGINISTTGGTSWSTVSFPSVPLGSFAHINNFIFAGGGAGIFYSTNNGDSWAQTPFAYPYVNALAVSGNYLFAGTEKNGIFVSSNNGATWTNINRNLGTRLSISRMLVSGNDLYISTYTNSLIQAPISNLVGVQNTGNSDIPSSFNLKQNYPNPFNPNTVISYRLSVAGDVSLKVYDLAGNEVAALVNEKQNAGSYSVTFDAGKYNLSSGVYFYKLNAGGFEDTKRMVLVK